MIGRSRWRAARRGSVLGLRCSDCPTKAGDLRNRNFRYGSEAVIPTKALPAVTSPCLKLVIAR